MKHIAFIIMVLLLCSCGKNKTDLVQSPNQQTEIVDKVKITQEMALEGVSNYCHSEYDWSSAKDNPSLMYVEMGEETDTAYQVKFRSYTGAFVFFYVNKASGTTRMVEYVPTLDIKTEAGTINLLDYLNPKN